MINVHFVRMDQQPVRFTRPARDMALFLKDHEPYRHRFFGVLRNSANWFYANIKLELKKKKRQLLKKRNKSEDDKNYIRLLEALFKQARSIEDLSDIRGIVPEQILQVKVEQERQERDGWKIETGCAVQINNREVIDRTPSIEKQKRTVDLGAWQYERQIGRFVEAKASPNTFKEPDSNYLKCLRAAFLRQEDVCFRIYIFAIDDKNLVRKAVLRAGYDIDEHTEIIGRDDIFHTNFLEVPLKAS